MREHGRIIEPLWLVDRSMDASKHNWQGLAKLCGVAGHGLCLRCAVVGDFSYEVLGTSKFRFLHMRAGLLVQFRQAILKGE